MHEQKLIALLKEGDAEAFREMILNYQVPLLRTCNGFLHNDEESRDVVQETFIEVFESIKAFRGDSKFSTWIYRIAVNKSLNLLRKRKMAKILRISGLFEKRGSSFDFNPVLPKPEMENKERKQILRKAIDALPESQRIAFVLNKYQDLTYGEVSEVMGVSLSSVESLLYRAKNNLQKSLYHLYKKNLL